MSGAVSFSWTLPPGPPLTERQRALVVEALPLAPKVVRRLAAPGSLAHRLAADLEGVAHEGFVWAAQKYDPGRGARWLSYAYGGALMRCRMWLRAMRIRDTRELDFVLGENSDGEEFTRLDVTPDPAPLADELLLRHRTVALVERLPERERIALQRHLDGATLADVGQAHGVAPQAVAKWERSGLRRIREELELIPKTPRRPRTKPAAPLDADERLRSLLTDGTPRTAFELAALTGYTPQWTRMKLRELGATQVGSDGRKGLWTLAA